jgi:minor extracellular serine protease Vpr
VHRQGAGMLEVDDAILADAFVMPSRIALGEIESGSKLWTIHIKRDRSPVLGRGRRRGGRDVVYTLGHEPALSSGPNTFTPTFSLSFGAVQFSTPKVALGGANGNEASILVTFTPPSDSTARLFGGYITLTPDDDGPILRVPYSGYNGDYQAIRVLTPTTLGFPLLAKLVGTSLIPQPNGATFSLQGPDVPYFLLHLDHPAAELKMEIIDVESGRSFNFADKERFLPRNSSATSFFFDAWDGTAIRRVGETPRPVPDGTYRIELSVLKALGDPHNPAHFERWTSPNVTIARPVSP